jgi:threonyl-tRNA synthetase
VAGGRAVHAPVYRDNGYQEVKGPQILDKRLWEKTGHWDKYRENMFTTESEKRDYALKPMNCPGHILIFKQGIKSYRDLPLRYGEFGQCHRNEPTGGCTASCACAASRRTTATSSAPKTRSWRVRGLHHAAAEGLPDFGFTDIIYKVATRPEQAHRLRRELGQGRARADGEPARSGCEFEISPGEGAFYGPKIEYTLKDALGRQWQCGTMQVDFNMPSAWTPSTWVKTARATGPMMLHRAIVGSLERFIGILIEQHAGALPAWLAPVQVVVLNITDARPTTPKSGENAAKTRS